MREYILRILGLAIFSAAAEIFLPEGNMRRLALPIIGLSVVAAILLPAVSMFTAGEDILLPAIEKTADTAVYSDAVLSRYKEAVIQKIAEKGGAVDDIEIAEDFSISHITLSAAESRTLFYITTELEVPRSHVEIR